MNFQLAVTYLQFPLTDLLFSHGAITGFSNFFFTFQSISSVCGGMVDQVVVVVVVVSADAVVCVL